MSSLDTASRTDVSASSGNEISSSSRFNTIALTVMLVVSVAINVMLALRVRELTSVQKAAIAERELKVGTVVPPIMAKRLNGGSETISYTSSDRPTVLYIFTPQCGWCIRNLDNLKTLLDNKGNEYRFIGISLSKEGLEEYIANHQLSFPVYTDIPKEVGAAYKMGGTPQTVVVSPQGQVMRTWVGAYVGEQKSEVETYFKVTLPGIQPKTE